MRKCLLLLAFFAAAYAAPASSAAAVAVSAAGESPSPLDPSNQCVRTGSIWKGGTDSTIGVVDECGKTAAERRETTTREPAAPPSKQPSPPPQGEKPSPSPLQQPRGAAAAHGMAIPTIPGPAGSFSTLALSAAARTTTAPPLGTLTTSKRSPSPSQSGSGLRVLQRLGGINANAPMFEDVLGQQSQHRHQNIWSHIIAPILGVIVIIAFLCMIVVWRRRKEKANRRRACSFGWVGAAGSRWC